MIRVLRELPARPAKHVRVGVSGGIGSGKSVLTAELGKLGALIFDADEVVRRAIEPGGKAYNRLRALLGTEVKPGESLNRVAARRIFAEPQLKAAFEAILHPLVWQELDEITDRMPDEEVLVAEIPLLTETGNHDRFDAVITVDAPVEERLRRTVESRHFTPDEVRARISNQADTSARQAITHLWVDNVGDESALCEDAAELWNEWLRPGAPRWR